MTCISDSCRTASDCTRHLSLLLQTDDTSTRLKAEKRIAALAEDLRALRSGSARNELVAAGSLLRARFTVDASGSRASLRPTDVLETAQGNPLVLGAVAVTAARQAGMALGLLAGARGRFVVAHATLARPLVLDLHDGFALRNVDGDESSFRWLCAHVTAQRVGELLAPQPVRRVRTGDTPARLVASPN
ncbi:hypothetical protein DSM112329_05080 [Paraconexibacter sp. AEG42_29]|uniref:Uncharacterized protein n=1 Tax=Paraconexibacter sp. AEG42_29 TaxID=2997339 RepID=A0AAU7B3J1_9ACTN